MKSVCEKEKKFLREECGETGCFLREAAAGTTLLLLSF